MKHLCYNRLVFSILFLLYATTIFAKSQINSFGVYYGYTPSDEIFSKYDDLILDPSNIDLNDYKKAYYNIKSQIFGYISLTEVAKDSKYFSMLKKDWIIGKNSEWNSVICDINNQEYVDFLLNRVIYDAFMEGYKNYFFDTIDSYYKLSDSLHINYIAGEIDFFKKFRKKYKDSKIILNRGFEIDSAVNPYAVVVESMYNGYSPKRGYYKVKNSSRNWLVETITKHNIKRVYCIEYLEKGDIDSCKKIEKLINNYGYSCFITNKELNLIGYGGKLQEQKRDILIIYDKSVSANDEVYSNVHRMGVMPIEYLGYKCDLVDVHDIDKIKDIEKYYGGIIWLEKNIYKNYKDIFELSKRFVNNNKKIVFIKYFGFPFTDKYLNFFNLKHKNVAKILDDSVIYKRDEVGFEANYVFENRSNIILVDSLITPIITEKSGNTIFSNIAYTKWGAYALGSSLITSNPKDMWIVNPFIFFQKSLNLRQDIPLFDVTTQTGNRICFSHLDGDGFMEKARFGKKEYSGEVLYREIFTKYNFPFSVSLIEGEVGKTGLYANISSKLEKIAKKIYKLPNIESASHTFSHPFAWKKLYRDGKKMGYSLPINNYTFSLNREILGSIHYIDSTMFNNHKKTKLLFWSGDCVPPRDALAITYNNGILNINGGDDAITNDNPFFTGITPIGIKRGIYYQIYAPMQNENIYTNLWEGPYYGFQRVIETIKLTDKKYRIKPIDIYYHFYSGSRIASLNALKKVYNYVINSDVIPMYTSDYIKKALGFYHSSIFSKNDSTYIIKTVGNIKTVKIFDLSLYPDLNKSKNIIGFKDIKGVRYIYLGNGENFKLVLTNKIPKIGYLKSINAQIDNINYKSNSVNIKGYSYLPLNIVLVNTKRGKVHLKRRYYNIKYINDTTYITVKKVGKYSVTYWSK